MIIKPLKDCPEFIEPVISWLNDEFGTPNSRNFYQGIITHSLIENQIPITFVALENDLLIGTVGLWHGDLLSRQELSPWLSALIVHPDYRNQGIGQKLQKYILSYCKSKAIKQVYLYTQLKNYYEKIGWVLFDTGYEFTGDKVYIYKYSL